MSQQASAQVHIEHRDDTASKIGMWLFIFTELLLFGGLFIVYSVYRYEYSTAFHLAGQELSVTMGTINTIVLLISSMSIAMSTTAIRRGEIKRTVALLGVTLVLALVFMVNKYFEWSGKIEHGLFPGSSVLQDFGQGDTLFFGLYFFMTGLHALHIIVGIVFIAVIMVKVMKEQINQDYNIQLENAGLYWHLVDLIWIFLFPLFYLIA
ncbi:MAG: cytochrome c oxidase subunit 3 family protein [Bacteroidota bacterium]